MSDKAHRSTFKLSIILSLIIFSTFLVVPSAVAADLQHDTDNSDAAEHSSSPTTVAESARTSRTTDSERSKIAQTPADKSPGVSSQAGGAKTPSTTNGTTALTPNEKLK